MGALARGRDTSERCFKNNRAQTDKKKSVNVIDPKVSCFYLCHLMYGR
jgi:hypothetical protein